MSAMLARLSSHVDPGRIRAFLSNWGGGAFAPPGRYRLLEDAQGEAPEGAGPLLLALGETQWMAVEIDLPPMAQAALRSSVEIEMDRLTPFRPQDVDWTFSVKRTPEGRRVRVLLAPKRFRSMCRHAIDGLLLMRGGEIAGYVPRQKETTPRLALLLPSCALLVALVTALAPNVELWGALQSVEAEPAPVARAGGRIDHPDFTPQPLRALAVVTELLSDDAYLEEMQVERDKIRMSGKAKDVSALLARLTASPNVLEPKLAGNVTRDRQSGVSSFEISLSLVLEARP